MDQRLGGLYGPMNHFSICDNSSVVSADHDLVSGLKFDGNSDNRSFSYVPVQPTSNIEGDSTEDYDFSDEVLSYINKMLMEEDMEEKSCMFQESSAALQAAEKSLYELIGEKYPHPPFPKLNLASDDEKHDTSEENCAAVRRVSGEMFNSSSSSNVGDGGLQDAGWGCDLDEHKASDLTSHETSQTSGSFISGTRFGDSPISTLRISDIFSDSESVKQFKRGFEEASKFIPYGGGLLLDIGDIMHFNKELKEEAENSDEKSEKKETSSIGSRGKKHLHPDNLEEDRGTNTKHSAISNESTVSPDMFDMVLLQCGSEVALRETLQNEISKNAVENGQSKGSFIGKGRSKQKGKKHFVDLRALLMLCAQAVAADDNTSANELLKQIREHCSSTGDGMQRITHYFAEALEARLAGSGTESYTAVISKPVSAASVLKAHHLFLAACPFYKISHFFSNKTIMNTAEKAPKVHIIDFGILYGFQWPCFIRRLSIRDGGPPKLRITGIDLPIPGFRPAERVEETGRRLAKYAKTFEVPFEFNAIAQKWDTIQIEDLKIQNDELLVVNCLYRLRNLLDETVVLESPRDKVLKLIRNANPDVFIQGVVNGAYSSPFFITRFREAFFQYSTFFDIFETTVPRDTEERMLIEREILSREMMNVVACEGAERIERPEIYKQWQVRTMRAGFKQLPLNEEIKKTAIARVTNHYHKDFLIDEDGEWLLQGWKGRIVFALSSWVPAS